MRKIYNILMILASILLMLGCTHEKTYKIGVSQCSSDDWRSKMNQEILREAMLHNDIEVEIRSAEDNSKKQIEDLNYFKANDFDLIIVAPNEADSLTPVVNSLYEEGIPVIVFDRNINDDSYTSRIGVDNEGMGAAAAKYALSLLGKEGIRAMEIYGLKGSTPAEERRKGFDSVLEAQGGEIVASGYANWKEGLARLLADSLLKAHPEINLIFAQNDRMAIGASKVAKEFGRKDIRVIGIDAAPNIGVKAVADSIIDATFLYPTEGHILVRQALKILKGEKFEKELILPLSSAVDLSNADILLLQNETLVEDTKKIETLKRQLDDYWAEHSTQTSLFYAIIVILILLFGFLFLVLRTFWQHRRHRDDLLRQNRLLEEERDKQKELNEKLEEATQSKLVFFTNVSHDLRTPLTLIAEPVAQLKGASNLSDSQKKLMHLADKNVKILHRLINQILDFRKYENDKLTLNLSEINFRQIIEEWVESFREAAKKKNIKLCLQQDFDPSTPSTIALDVEKIERVFFNLISNALKYSRENDSITISYSLEKDFLTIKVADTGEGISERDLGNIFDRFFQVDRVRPRGSGIGLSLAKAFVELHGGTISVESELNKGSVFTVILPVRHVSEEVKVVSAAFDSETVNSELQEIESNNEFSEEKPLLLIIDDNADIRLLVSELMREDYNILTATNGSEGIKKAIKYVPDLIICDVMMPGIDGMEVCKRLKEEVSTSHIPVLMLTACSMDEQKVQGFESGADGYLAKPFSGLVLKSQADSLISNRRRIKGLWQQSSLPLHVEQEKERKPLAKNNDIENEFYNHFLEIFNENISDPDLNVEAIAGRLGLERTQFYRKIKALTNYSPVELMRNLRLKKAREMVTATDRTLSEIGYAVGFSTPAYFTKCYRELYGETPSETRAGLG